MAMPNAIQLAIWPIKLPSLYDALATYRKLENIRVEKYFVRKKFCVKKIS